MIRKSGDEALARFLDTEDGGHLLAGIKRAINIVRIEEKRDNTSYDGPPDRNLLFGVLALQANLLDQAEFVEDWYPLDRKQARPTGGPAGRTPLVRPRPA